MVDPYDYVSCVLYTTTYFPPTSRRGAKIGVVGGSNKAKTYDWDHGKNVIENHRRAFEDYLHYMDSEPTRRGTLPSTITVSDAPRGFYFHVDPV